MLLYSTILLALLMPLLTILAYRQGIKDGRAIKEDKPMGTIKTVTKAVKPTQENKYWDTIIDNINNYDGTGRGQVDVE